MNKSLRSIVRTIAGGCLLALFLAMPLRAQDRPYRGAEYRTTSSYQYGRCEVRMKSAPGNGLLTSFFTFHDPSPFSTALWNEIDIEILGRYTDEAQYNTITPGQINHVFRQVLHFNPHLAFHVYAIEWTPDYVAWFADGYEVYRQTASHVETLLHPQKIMMNIWQPNSVSWVGLFDPAGLPYHGYYDWVKYYAYTPGVGDNFTWQWTDDFESWDQNRWAKASHTFDGNNAQFTPDNAVFRNGYMILCLTSPNATGYRGGVIVDLDLDPPYLIRARAEGQNLTADFSEELDQPSAETVSHYTIPGVPVESATLLPGNQSVLLHTHGLLSDQSYVLVANGIQDRSPSKWQMGVQYTNVVHGLQLPININVAGEALDAFLPDQTWDSFQEYGAIGGEVKTRPAGTVIAGTDQAALYHTEREALSFYQVRVPNGRYRITLLLADSDYEQAGERLFDVYAEGQLLFDHIDIVAEAGKNTALEKTSSEIAVTDGRLDLYFKPLTGTTTLSGLKIAMTGASSVKSPTISPTGFTLGAYPNPFNPSTKLIYTQARAGTVRLVLFDALGREMGNLIRAAQPAGKHTHTLAAEKWTAGVYFVKLLCDEQVVATTKLLYLK